MSIAEAVVVRLFEEVWSTGNLAVLDEIMHSECHARSANDTTLVQGVENYQKMVAGYLALYGEVNVAVDAQVTEDDLVATRWTARLRARSDDPGLMGMSFHRVEAGRIVECWDTWDSMRALEVFGGEPLSQLTLATG